MFKIGQKVKFKAEHYATAPHFKDPETVYVILFIHDNTYAVLNTLPNDPTPVREWVVPMEHIRPLMKKKPPFDPKKAVKFAPSIPAPTLKGEISWMNRVQKNFKNDGASIQDVRRDDDGLLRRAMTNHARELEAELTQQIRVPTMPQPDMPVRAEAPGEWATFQIDEPETVIEPRGFGRPARLPDDADVRAFVDEMLDQPVEAAEEDTDEIPF